MKNKGITLISLIITIIVLLILAGITISMLTGENGILNRAENATKESIKGQELESVSLSWNAIKTDKLSNTDTTNIKAEELKKELEKYDKDISVVEKIDGTGTLTITFNKTGNIYTINQDGTVKNESALQVDERLSDWEYTTSDENSTITLTKYIGTNPEVTVYSTYKINNQHYATIMQKNIGWDSPFSGNTIITKVTFEDNVNFEENSMACTFKDCTSLKEVINIPNNVTSMWCTFDNCDALVTAPEIPDSVTNMTGTFTGCKALTTVPNIPNCVTNMSQAFFGCYTLTTIPNIPDNVTSMDQTFSGCYALETVPNLSNAVGLKNIQQAFYKCTSLEKVPELPDSVEIMTATFYGCESIKSIAKIPSNVITMQQAFQECTSLTSVAAIPSKVENMEGTFNKCSSLKTPPDMSNASSLINMTATFNNCTALTQTSLIPTTVTTMDYTFAGCSKLTTVTSEIPETVTSMNTTFAGCKSLTGTITIKSSNITSAASIVDGTYGFYNSTETDKWVKIITPGSSSTTYQTIYNNNTAYVGKFFTLE